MGLKQENSIKTVDDSCIIYNLENKKLFVSCIVLHVLYNNEIYCSDNDYNQTLVSVDYISYNNF